jgi:hypothetical protein
MDNESPVMQRVSLPPHLLGVSSDALLAALTTHQHVHPHDPVAHAVHVIGEALGVCPNAAEAAMSRLQVDGLRSIGRMRRTELIQLARAIHRLWSQQRPGANPSQVEAAE